MQTRKYVFIVRQDGSFRHCRYRSWRNFLSGNATLTLPGFLPEHSTGQHSIISLEIDNPITQVNGAVLMPPVIKRISSIDSDGLLISSECYQLKTEINPSVSVKALSPDGGTHIQHSIHHKKLSTITLVPQEAAKVNRQQKSRAVNEAVHKAIDETALMEGYINQLMEDVVQPERWHQYDAFSDDKVAVTSAHNRRCA